MFNLQNIIYSALVIILPVLTYAIFSREIFEILWEETTHKILNSILVFLLPLVVIWVFVAIEMKLDFIYDLKKDMMWSYYGIISLIEETIKIWAALIFLKVYRHSIVWDEKTSLSAFLLAWLTFWAIENIMYYASYTWQSIWTFVFVRQIFDIPVHLLFSLLSFYAIYYIMSDGWKNKPFKDYIYAILYIVLPHTIFNVSLESGGNWVLIAFIMAIIWLYQSFLFFSWENIYSKREYTYD